MTFLSELTGNDLLTLINTHIDHPLAISDIDGSFIWANTQFANRLGYTPRELLDISWKDLTVDSGDLDLDESLALDTLEGDIKQYHLFKQYWSKNKKPIPTPLTVARFPQEGGRDEFRFFIVNVCEEILTMNTNRAPISLSSAMLECAEMSKLAYPDHPKDTTSAWKEQRRQEGYDTITAGSTQCLIKVDQSRATIAFRGTQLTELADIITDLRTTPTPIGCRLKVHQGADQALDQIWCEIRRYLEERPHIHSVSFCGHSLGGLLAQLAMFRACSENVSLDYLIVFGSPPAGNQPFASSLCAILGPKMVRVTRCADLVPRLKWMWFRGYRHANGHYYIDRDSRFWRSPSSSFQIADRMAATKLLGKRTLSVSHHSIDDYSSMVQEYFE